jgi:Uma2 family endonuclease
MPAARAAGRRRHYAMPEILNAPQALPLVLHLAPVIAMSDDQFFRFCQLNRDLRIERTSQGDLLIMPPTGGETGRRNFELAARFGDWVRADGRGIGFDSSTGFTLPNGATRSPDIAWVQRPRWESLAREQRERFVPLCPDFVVELRSRTDSIEDLRMKMQEYLDNGSALGWLIDPIERRVYVYRSQAPVEILDDPPVVSGEPLLRGFALELRAVWG